MSTVRRPLAKIAEVAERYLGVREVTKNRSPIIAQFWDYTDYREGDENREPWCCAAVVAWIQIADAETNDVNLLKPPKMAAVRHFLEWARRPVNKCLCFSPSDGIDPQIGDIAIFLPNLSHIGVVAKDYTRDGFVHLIEGNTNQEGSREGDGVYRKRRPFRFAGTYVRLPVTKA